MACSWPSTFDLSIFEQNYLSKKWPIITEKNGLSRNSEDNFEYDSLISSRTFVNIVSKNCITLDTPASVAAPMVNLVAKNTINLGCNLQEKSCGMTLYAQNISMTARELNVGDLRLSQKPEHAAITCKTLNLSWYAGEEEPAIFEVITSWMMNDDVEIVKTY